MTIEFSFATGIFHTYEICTGEQYGKVFGSLGDFWSVYVYTKNKTPSLISPSTALRCRYQGVIYETLHDDVQLAMLKHKLETDFAIERLG